jgi:hypothetical protein
MNFHRIENRRIVELPLKSPLPTRSFADFMLGYTRPVGTGGLHLLEVD